MPDYSKAKIYKITSSQSEKIYIGSTTSTLSQRLSQHKNILNKCASKELLQYDDTKIELIEDYPCKSGRELREREFHYINTTVNCINKIISLAPCNEYVVYQDDKQYIVLSQKDETFRVVQKEIPTDELPDNVIIMQPRSVLSALKGYIYDINRKKKAYHQKKEKLKAQPGVE